MQCDCVYQVNNRCSMDVFLHYRENFSSIPAWTVLEPSTQEKTGNYLLLSAKTPKTGVTGRFSVRRVFAQDFQQWGRVSQVGEGIATFPQFSSPWAIFPFLATVGLELVCVCVCVSFERLTKLKH